MRNALNKSVHLKAVLLSFEGILTQPDAEAIIQYLRSKHLRLGILSRKSPATVRRAVNKLASVDRSAWEVIIGGDELLTPKAGTNTIKRAAERMKLPANRILVVSSQPDHIQAGIDAGAVTAYLNKPAGALTSKADSDYFISSFRELKKIVRMGISLPPGKLPNDLLREFLNDFIFDDPSILINPGVGEDIAAVNIEAEQILVLKSDPITFATDSIGQYAVLINANDIATSGAAPRWLLTTLLFPYGVTASEIRLVINELKEFCRQWDITLCGGHTEITDAVLRPVVTGMMAGTVARKDLIDKRNIRVGDRILLTKRVAVEGTAIIAREFKDRLGNLGLANSEIEKCCQFLSNISIIREAKIAAGFEGTSAMHDVTEGGLATALEELGVAGGHRIRIDMEKIPVFAETRKICRLFDIDPLGLIGSGSLLICCRKEWAEKLMTAIEAAGIEVACIGEILAQGQGIEARKHNKPMDWPRFEVDEITKLF
jgi:hydrogenase expression/formation protein HypE